LVSFGFVARPHSGFGPPCGAREWLLGLSDAALNALATATLGVFFWLQITHINLRFVFLLFAHITFLSLLVVSLVLGCASRAEIFAAAYDLFVWDQVVQTDQLIFRTLLPLSSTLPGICVLFFPSTNSHPPYYHYLCHVIFALDFFRNSQFLIDI